jgi:hypothetical protein
VEQEPVSEQNVQMEADQVVDQLPPKQMKTTSVKASNGEDIIDNYLNIVNQIEDLFEITSFPFSKMIFCFCSILL